MLVRQPGANGGKTEHAPEQGIFAEEASEQRRSEHFVPQGMMIGYGQVAADGDALAAESVSDSHRLDSAGGRQLEHEGRDRGDAGIGKMPQGKMGPAVA